jgi:hypothetical protein
MTSQARLIALEALHDQRLASPEFEPCPTCNGAGCVEE